MKKKSVTKAPYASTALKIITFSLLMFGVLSIPRAFDLHALEVVGSAGLVLAAMVALTASTARARVGNAHQRKTPISWEASLTLVLPLIGAIYLLRVSLG